MKRRDSAPIRWLRRAAKRTEFWPLVLAIIVLTAMLVFFEQEHRQVEDVIDVNLDRTSVISPVKIRDSALNYPGNSALRAAIAGVLSPTKSLEYYEELLTHLGQKLDRKVALFLRPTYAEINDLISSQRIDVAFVCSLAYVQGNQDFGMELLVVPQINGQTVYYSYLIVPEDSSTATLEDLKGAVFAFTDPLSNSGHLAPSYQLSLLNEIPASFFGRYVFTYSHDNSITAVASKLVDAAAVDSLIYDQMTINDMEQASGTKIIARWGPYGIPPVVVHPTLDPELKQQLRYFFLNLHNSSEGNKILNSLGIDKFVVVPDNTYDSVREMKTKLGW